MQNDKMRNREIQKALDKILFNDERADAFLAKLDYGSAAKILLEQQQRSWPQLAAGYDSLKTVQTKSLEFDGYEIKVQFNPGRIFSSSAKVDAASIKNRKCFLCFENLPSEQKGILYGQDYLILGNPFPIFPEHFTLPNINHFPQAVKGSFAKFLSFAKDMSKHYTVFYNGPKCGASAPDHLHFQAGNKFFMPLDSEFGSLKKKFGEILFEDEGMSVAGIDDGLRRYISIEGDGEQFIKKIFEKFYGIYQTLTKTAEEPMMNILASYLPEEGWRVIIFLRSKHRSSHYFAEGEDNILLSPASVDIGGVCITPLEKDFNKITKDKLIEIFREISIGKEYFDYVKTSLKK